MPPSESSSLRSYNANSTQYKGADERSDAGLLVAARLGDPAAFGELCNRHSGSIMRLARRIVRNAEDAEDTLQEAALSAYVHLHQFDGRSSFSTWLTRIAINASLMRLRKNRRRATVSLDACREGRTDSVPLEIADSAPTPDAIFATHERMAFLERGISEIQPHLRTAIEFRILEDLSAKETAAALGISVSAAKTRLFRARNELREQLKRGAPLALRHSKRKI